MIRVLPCIFCLIALAPSAAFSAGEKLYGVHWWDYANPTVGSGPQNGWSVETIVTESDPWWRAPYFVPLYQQATTTHNAAMITRVDYNWGQTVPAPSSSPASAWANKIVNEVIGPLGAYANRWIIGNEPNINGEGNGWAANQITPSGYAQIYHTVRQVIKAQRPQDEVLFAPVSPGGVIPNVRWKDGNQWLTEAIDATLALPGGAIDGFAIHAYGNPFVGAAQAVAEFHDSYVSQLEVIDSRSLQSAPVYLTEWNRATSTTGNLAANEQVSADFLRQSLLDVDAWNRWPGNHNIRAMGWFVNEAYGGWQEYSLEWWRSQGNPEGHPGDLWTALMDSSQLQAGLAGTRPITDYNSDGVVDAGDWIAWRANFGRYRANPADGSRNNVVDAADYVLWRKSASTSVNSGSAVAIPEPSSAWQLLLGAFVAAFVWRRGRQFWASASNTRECLPVAFGIVFTSVVATFFIAAVGRADTNAQDDSASVVVVGRIWTGDAERPWAEGVAIAGERVLAVGSREDVARYGSEQTQIIDAGDGLVVPGLIDSHIHLIDGGERLASVQLRDADSREVFVDRIAEYARGKQPGQWITGGDWDHSLWGGELPSRDWIDAATPDNPVWINRLDGHMSLANSAAMRLAKVGDDVGDVSGGEIVRDAAGRPTGIFKDNAMSLIDRAVPETTIEEQLASTTAAMDYLAERGVTAVHHMGSWRHLQVFRLAQRRGQLKTRIFACTPLEQWQRLADEVRARGRGDEWLKIGGLKGFVDGSLGSHTAAFLQPFSDAPNDRGLLVNTAEDLEDWTMAADRAGLQVAVHAIGDRAIRLQLDVFERVAAANGPRDRRFRIEHAQHIAPQDIPRFAKLDVIASMQPYHAIDDGRWAERLIGAERSETTYAFRSLIDEGARLAFGSDWFVAPPTPMDGIYAAVTRRTLDGEHPDGWVPRQKISVEESLRAYTLDAAYAAFSESSLGSLEPGKLADLVILEQNIFDIPPHQINEVRIIATIVGGKVVYRKTREQSAVE